MANCLRASGVDFFYDEQGSLIHTEHPPARRTPTGDDLMNQAPQLCSKSSAGRSQVLPHLAGEITHLLQNLTLLPQQSPGTFSVSLIKKGWGLYHINGKGKLMNGRNR